MRASFVLVFGCTDELVDGIIVKRGWGGVIASGAARELEAMGVGAFWFNREPAGWLIWVLDA
jgi:hypothetical protein